MSETITNSQVKSEKTTEKLAVNTKTKSETSNAKSRKQTVTKKQLDILYLIYRFRFVSTKHVQLELKQKNIQSAQLRLKLLLDNKYITRNYTGRDKLTGRYASYYLLPKGIQLLKKYRVKDCYEQSLHWLYKDRTATWQFSDHQISLGDIYCKLYELYNDKLEFFTKSELVADDGFPKPLPDVFMKIGTGKTKTKAFFLDYYDPSMPYFKLRNRIKQYLDFAGSGEWGEELLPTVLMVCANPRILNRMIRVVRKELDRSWEEMDFMGVTKYALLKSVAGERVWVSLEEEGTKKVDL